MRSETIAIRTQSARSLHREHSVPLFLTSSFVFDDAEQARALFAEERQGPVYSRYSNPNTDEFVEKLRLLEHAEDGIATASGMAAIFAALGAILSAGDHIVVGRAVFGSTHQLLTRILPRWGIAHDYVDGDDPSTWSDAIRPNTKAIFVESPSNPGLDLIDLTALGTIARERGIPLIVDNCFATPIITQPISLGASLVVHSATKYIDGQGRVLGGALVGDAGLIAEVRFLARHSGPALSPFNAWVLSKSIETLALRMERHSLNAQRIAERLQSNAAVESVRYPHLPSHPQHALALRQMSAGGGVLTLRLSDYDSARRFIDGLTLCSHSPNLGDTRTIVTHPASTTHSKLTDDERARVGITPGLVRISVGLEDPLDVLADIERALSPAAQHAP